MNYGNIYTDVEFFKICEDKQKPPDLGGFNSFAMWFRIPFQVALRFRWVHRQISIMTQAIMRCAAMVTATVLIGSGDGICNLFETSIALLYRAADITNPTIATAINSFGQSFSQDEIRYQNPADITKPIKPILFSQVVCCKAAKNHRDHHNQSDTSINLPHLDC